MITRETRKNSPVLTEVKAVVEPVDPRVTQAMRDIPRQVFLSAEMAELAYDQRHLPAPEGQTLQPPEMTARLLSALRVTSDGRVLEIGTGVGYTTALLSRLAREVLTVERLGPLVDVARRNLEAVGATNVQFHHGLCHCGWPEQAPYDAILVSASGLMVPLTLRRQLKIGGRLVMPLGPHKLRQTLIRVTRRSEEEYIEENLGELRFVERIGDILVDLGSCESAQAEEAARAATAVKRPIGEILKNVTHISEAEIYQALAAQRGMKVGLVDALLKDVDVEVVKSVSRAFLEHNRIIPVTRTGDIVTLATCDPDPNLLELSKTFHPGTLEICLVSPTDYRRLWSAIDLILSGAKAARHAAAAVPPLNLEETMGLSGGEPDAHFVHLFETVVAEAIVERASDIHLERYGDRIRVRIRVDGDLRDLDRVRLNTHDLMGLINVIKIRAELDIAEHRLPQGGRIRARIKNQTYDMRVQTQPSLYGEHAVIRLLPQEVRCPEIDELGFPPEVALEFRRLIEQPSGLILVVGPTGSGKTTTLYAGLRILANDLTRKVITVEDPIEYAIEGVQQSQVRPEIGFAFADAMRSFVRQDPDAILVGEIRDHETALEAIRASQTGHLVFSTLHCNEATDAVQRMLDLNIHPNSMASELQAILAQRLARRICEHCRTETEFPVELKAEVFPAGMPEGFRCWKGSGCVRCGNYGVQGRVACVEFLRTGEEMRDAIARHASVGELRRLALAGGMLTMRESALRLVNGGVIGPEELPVILAQERLAPEVVKR